MSEIVETVPSPASTPAAVASWLTEAFTELGLDTSGDEDDFFALGGTSLSAMRLIAKVEERFGEDALPPEDLYERAALGQIAETIVRNASADAGSGDAADGR